LSPNTRPDPTLKADVTVVDWVGDDESDLIAVLQQITDRSGPIGGFIHLHPALPAAAHWQDLFPAIERLRLKQLFLIAKHLKNPLTESDTDSRRFFVTITRMDGGLGTIGDKPYSAIAGGCFGLIKTLHAEWETVFCRAVDLCPSLTSSDAVDRILAELQDPDHRLTECGHRQDVRQTLIAEITEREDRTLSSITTIDRNAVFVVSGGAKGVTAACVIELAKRFQCRFILLGRSQPPADDPIWAVGCTDETALKKRCMDHLAAQGEKPTPRKIMALIGPLQSARQIRSTLVQVEDAGGSAEYISTDIKQPDSLRQALIPVLERAGTVTGLIHGAGVLADNRIEKKTAADFDAVYNTKINGLVNLLGCIPPDSIDRLILFSSAAGFYGNDGQSDYAMANEVLNKFAHNHQQRYPGCSIAALNWGPWDGGMVTPELKKRFEERRITVIPPKTGAQILTDVVASPHQTDVQLVIGSTMTTPRSLTADRRSYRYFRRLRLDTNPFLVDHMIGDEAVLPLIGALSWMTDSCRHRYPGFRLESAENTRVLKGIVFNAQCPETFQIDIDEQTIDPTGGRIRFGVKISSLNQDGKSAPHYSAVIVLTSREAQMKHQDDIDLRPVDPIAGQVFYQNGTLFHGPIFRSVQEQLNGDVNRLTLRCCTPAVDETTYGQFSPAGFNFFADDACLQALLIWARIHYQVGSLPLTISDAQCYRPIPFDTTYFVSLKIVTANRNRLVADVCSHDAAGTLYSRWSGVEAALSESLAEKFRR
jgi:NAD(P)-dependent dehydrogenase (short-subunit alcohol dehydrogenase family)